MSQAHSGRMTNPATFRHASQGSDEEIVIVQYWEWIACEDFQMPVSARHLDHINPESFAFLLAGPSPAQCRSAQNADSLSITKGTIPEDVSLQSSSCCFDGLEMSLETSDGQRWD